MTEAADGAHRDDTDVERWLSAPTPVSSAAVPSWVARLAHRARRARPDELSRNDPPAAGASARQAAVLILLGDDGDHGPDVLLQQRSHDLRTHAGEVSFPGGRREPGDENPVATALREAAEETDLDPDGVTPLVVLPRLLIRPSGYQVTGVLAYWHRPTPVRPADATETATVFRLPLAALLDPRHQLTYATVGWRGPAFRVDDALIWGYTGELLSAMLRFGFDAAEEL